jgi:hypothetical protein
MQKGDSKNNDREKRAIGRYQKNFGLGNAQWGRQEIQKLKAGARQ